MVSYNCALDMSLPPWLSPSPRRRHPPAALVVSPVVLPGFLPFLLVLLLARTVVRGAGSPAGQQAQGVLGGRPGLGGVGEEALAGIGGQRERLACEVEVTDDRVVDEFHAGGVDPDVVGGPSGPELVAAGGQLPDQVRESPVVGIAAGLGAQQGDRVVGYLVPVAEELARVWVEEDEPGIVGRPDRVGVDRREKRIPEVVGGQDVQASVEHERGRAAHRVQDALHRGPDALRGRCSELWRWLGGRSLFPRSPGGWA